MARKQLGAAPSAPEDSPTKAYTDTQVATRAATVHTHAAEDISTGTELTTSRLRLGSTVDLTLASTTHAFQIGPTAGLNLAIDQNSIIPRNNGVLSSLSFGSAVLNAVGAPVAGTDAVNKTWANTLTIGTVTPATGFTVTGSQLKLAPNGLVVLTAAVTNTAAITNGATIGTITAPFRPINASEYAYGAGSAAATPAGLRVDSNGNLVALMMGSSTAIRVTMCYYAVAP
jgi:hypothetical protein